MSADVPGKMTRDRTHLPVSRVLVEYDGGAYKGWAVQPGQRTVQAELERALGVVLQDEVKLTVAGRTDAGVHAWGQVASYAGEPVSVRRVNSLLPDDVTVLACDAAPAGFDARQDAAARIYCYRVALGDGRPALLRGRVWHWGWELDRELLDECASVLVGEHDFRAFTLSDQPYSTYRRVIARTAWIERPAGVLEFWIEGDSFTRRMVRTLVAYQLEVARGLRSFDDLRTLLSGADRAQAGGTAPAEGLYLAAVSYDPPIPGTLAFGESRS